MAASELITDTPYLLRPVQLEAYVSIDSLDYHAILTSANANLQALTFYINQLDYTTYNVKICTTLNSASYCLGQYGGDATQVVLIADAIDTGQLWNILATTETVNGGTTYVLHNEFQSDSYLGLSGSNVIVSPGKQGSALKWLFVLAPSSTTVAPAVTTYMSTTEETTAAPTTTAEVTTTTSAEPTTTEIVTTTSSLAPTSTLTTTMPVMRTPVLTTSTPGPDATSFSTSTTAPSVSRSTTMRTTSSSPAATTTAGGSSGAKSVKPKLMSAVAVACICLGLFPFAPSWL